MKHLLIAASALALASPAHAEGELNIFNWGNYTSPEAIKKFEAENDVKVTITDYDSNDAALAKIEAGGHGFDIVVPSAGFIRTFAEKGLIQELDHSRLPGIANIEPRWVDVPWDQGRKWSVPYLWGSTALAVNTKVYGGDINTSEILFNPPPELAGKVNILPEMSDAMALAIFNMGGEYCTEDLELLKKVRDKLVAAKPKWVAIDYGAIEGLSNNNYAASMEWNGAALRARQNNPDVKYGYPKEGYPIFMDSLTILRDAQNVDNAYKFLDFALQPENAAMFSGFAKYANGVTGSQEFLPEDMKDAPEVNIPDEFVDKGHFLQRCEGKGMEYMTAIWTEINK